MHVKVTIQVSSAKKELHFYTMEAISNYLESAKKGFQEKDFSGFRFISQAYIYTACFENFRVK